MSYITSHSSPNHSPRNGAAISMIVLHATVGSLASSLSWLTNVASRVSSHYLIGQDGTVYQLVADSEAAWHAGVSSWLGLNSEQIQHCSLGIELENMTGVTGFKGQDPYPAVQLHAAHDLCAQKIARYKIERAMLVRHLDIAPGRKTDPAGFPWAQFVEGLYPVSTPPPPTVPTMPLPVVQTYTVKGMPLVGVVVYQAQSLTGAVAGFLPQGATVEIDELYDGDVGHVKGGLGFVSLKGLQVGPL